MLESEPLNVKETCLASFSMSVGNSLTKLPMYAFWQDPSEFPGILLARKVIVFFALAVTEPQIDGFEDV
ncbi:hypothetical protein L2E82_31547 [Cichorium intybus]|uniref:Uncharacterized protein n=1 Tax=Cichorium intybus TaxID=13427 RepID=A0ACB9BG80_CICIN|nr:hypothetical protein L2E82_31547 [Cichorium intybus]